MSERGLPVTHRLNIPASPLHGALTHHINMNGFSVLW
jgi:hypothetical protein